ncbi:insulinase family protein [candidate division WWE3 bacterium]|nr:insulinase family protein [candidate division WWE3 bacterium]
MKPWIKHTLPNGLRIIFVPKKDSPSTTVTVMVGVGSRQETDAESGISHFIEHNVFKATTNRPKRNQTTEQMEGLGAVTNAATGHEFTYYYAKAAAFQTEKILDIVMDISLNMTFPQEDVDIEKGNVIEEINMYQDNPSARIMEKFTDFIWQGHPLGRSILGTKETVSSFNRDVMLEYVNKHYVLSQMIVVVSGSFDETNVAKIITEYYQHATRTGVAQDLLPYIENQEKPQILVDHFESQQSHICVGVKSFGRTDDRRYALDTINSVLGQGLSSRLFRRIRDELGLAYYIGSMNYEYADTGIWFARAGVDNKRAALAVSAILEEFKKLASEKIGEEELRKAKEYIKGKTLLGVETSDNVGEWYGFQELQNEDIITPEEYNQRIEQVSAQELMQVASDLLQNKLLNLGIIGPFSDSSEFEKILTLE